MNTGESILQLIDEVTGDLSEEEIAALPKDGAENHDYYIQHAGENMKQKIFQYVICFNKYPGFTLPIGVSEGEAEFTLNLAKAQVDESVNVDLELVPTEMTIPDWLKLRK